MDIEQLLKNAIEKHRERLIKPILDKDGDEEDKYEQINRLANEKDRLERNDGVDSPLKLFELYYDRITTRIKPLTPIRQFEKALNDFTEERSSIPAYGKLVQAFCSQPLEKVIDQYAEMVAIRIVINELHKITNPNIHKPLEEEEFDDPINMENLIFEKKYVAYVSVIFEKFSDCFDSNERERWIERFVYPSNRRINKFLVDKSCKEYNNRTILLSILSVIKKIRKREFPYEIFVEERFGIKDFFSNVSKIDQKNPKIREGFEKAQRVCKDVFKDLPFDLT